MLTHKWQSSSLIAWQRSRTRWPSTWCPGSGKRLQLPGAWAEEERPWTSDSSPSPKPTARSSCGFSPSSARTDGSRNEPRNQNSAAHDSTECSPMAPGTSTNFRIITILLPVAQQHKNRCVQECAVRICLHHSTRRRCVVSLPHLSQGPYACPDSRRVAYCSALSKQKLMLWVGMTFYARSRRTHSAAADRLAGYLRGISRRSQNDWYHWWYPAEVEFGSSIPKTLAQLQGRHARPAIPRHLRRCTLCKTRWRMKGILFLIAPICPHSPPVSVANALYAFHLLGLQGVRTKLGVKKLTASCRVLCGTTTRRLSAIALLALQPFSIWLMTLMTSARTRPHKLMRRHLWLN